MPHIPIPPEFLIEVKALRYAPATASAAWLDIVMAFWCFGIPFPDPDDGGEIIRLSKLAPKSFQRVVPIVSQCIVEMAPKIEAKYTARTKVRQKQQEQMRHAAAYRVPKSRVTQLTQHPTNTDKGATITSPLQGAVRNPDPYGHAKPQQTAIRKPPGAKKPSVLAALSGPMMQEKPAVSIPGELESDDSGTQQLSDDYLN